MLVSSKKKKEKRDLHIPAVSKNKEKIRFTSSFQVLQFVLKPLKASSLNNPYKPAAERCARDDASPPPLTTEQ